MKSNGACRTITLLMTCFAVMLTSCSDVPVLSGLSTRSKGSSFNSGYGPPDHAPAWGYRRKQGQTAVVGSETVVVADTKGTEKKDDDSGSDKTALLVAGGAAVAAGTVYAVVNERDKQQTQEELDQIRQDMNVVMVNITNSNGSISQVRLQKQGVGYVGPNGEFYDHLPTEAELKPIYGM